MLHGLWLPIYGGGVMLIAVLLYRLRNRLLVCFAGDMVYSRIHPNAGAGITDYKQAEVVETASDANAGIETVAEVGS